MTIKEHICWRLNNLHSMKIESKSQLFVIKNVTRDTIEYIEDLSKAVEDVCTLGITKKEYLTDPEFHAALYKLHELIKNEA